MKAALVTSRMTYVPDNYLSALNTVLTKSPSEIGGLILIDNLELSLLKTAAGLAALGCFGVAQTLLKNSLSLFNDPREAIFRSRGLPVLRVSNMNSEEVLNWIDENQIDLIVNMRTRCVYREPVLTRPRLGCINIHHGLLPDYRGTMCDLNALADNRDAGFTIHVMTAKIDAGPILCSKVVNPAGSNESDYLSYLKKSSLIEGSALSELLEEIRQLGQLPEGRPNVPQLVTYTRNPNRKRIREMQKRGFKL